MRSIMAALLLSAPQLFLFLTTLDLHCCVDFLGVVSGDYSLVAGWSYSLWCLLLWWNKGSSVSELSSCDSWAELHVVSSQTEDQTHAPCIGRQIINHWTTREVSGSLWIQRKTWAVQTKGDIG